MNAFSEQELISNALRKYKHIAVYGMSPEPDRPSHYVPAYMQEQGYSIYPIHPQADKILGLQVHKSIHALPQGIEILYLFRRSEKILDLMPEILERRNECQDIQLIWLPTGVQSDSAKALAESAGIGFVQDRCMMVEYPKLSA